MIEKLCANCKFVGKSIYERPCSCCDNDLSEFVKQTTETEEINHPKRYAGGTYECIDVMLDVFGKEAVKNFCKLNAFKYIWREKQKNGVEDIKKAMFYMDYYIKLTEEENETDK